MKGCTIHGPWIWNISVAIFLVVLFNSPPLRAESGRKIVEKSRELHTVSNEEEILRVTIVNKAGDLKRRKIVWYSTTDPDYMSKILIRFLAPRDVEGTGLLVWEAKGGNDDQWLYLPAARKVKRIPASGKKNRFMGTDFAYEREKAIIGVASENRGTSRSSGRVRAI